MQRYVSAKQVKMARANLGWTQAELAKQSKVAKDTVNNLENGATLQMETLNKIVNTIELHGLEFTENNGVQDRQGFQVYEGKTGFLDFYEDVYHTLKASEDRLVYVSNVDERQFVAWQGDQLNEHIERVKKLKAQYKILIQHGDTYFPAEAYAEYRWISPEAFQSIPTYLYGHKVAYIVFGHKPQIFILNVEEITDLHRRQFEAFWKSAEKPNV